ncbi:MAG: sigma-70 family RNA polymerase sigma factor [Polyangiaceae bacterium]
MTTPRGSDPPGPDEDGADRTAAEPAPPASRPKSAPEPDDTASADPDSTAAELVAAAAELAAAADPEYDDPGVQPLPPLDEILPEHLKYVRTVVSRFGVSPTHQREDLVQEVLIEAHRSRTSHLQVRALLHGITRHIVFRWLAKREAERQTLETHARDAPTTVRSAEDQWQEEERRQAVRASIDALPDIYREVFVRAELDDMTMPEVAKDLGIPVNTGYTRLYLARNRFVEALRRYLARRGIRKEDLSLFLALGGALDNPPAPAAPDATAPDTTPPDTATAPDAPSPAGSPDPAPLRAPPAPPSPPAPQASARGSVEASPRPPPPPSASPSGSARPPPSPPPASKPSPVPTPSRPRTPPAPTRASSPLAAPPPASPPSTGPQMPVPSSTAPRSTPPPDPTTTPVQVASTPAADSADTTTQRSEGIWARSIVGLARAGRRDQAATEAAQFRKLHPRSTYLLMIDEALAAP